MTNQQKAEQKKDTDVTQLLTEEQINEVLNSRILMVAGHKFFTGKTTELLQAQSDLTLRMILRRLKEIDRGRLMDELEALNEELVED